MLQVDACRYFKQRVFVVNSRKFVLNRVSAFLSHFDEAESRLFACAGFEVEEPRVVKLFASLVVEFVYVVYLLFERLYFVVGYVVDGRQVVFLVFLRYVEYSLRTFAAVNVLVAVVYDVLQHFHHQAHDFFLDVCRVVDAVFHNRHEAQQTVLVKYRTVYQQYRIVEDEVVELHHVVERKNRFFVHGVRRLFECRGVYVAVEVEERVFVVNFFDVVAELVARFPHHLDEAEACAAFLRELSVTEHFAVKLVEFRLVEAVYLVELGAQRVHLVVFYDVAGGDVVPVFFLLDGEHRGVFLRVVILVVPVSRNVLNAFHHDVEYSLLDFAGDFFSVDVFFGKGQYVLLEVLREFSSVYVVKVFFSCRSHKLGQEVLGCCVVALVHGACFLLFAIFYIKILALFVFM